MIKFAKMRTSLLLFVLSFLLALSAAGYSHAGLTTIGVALYSGDGTNEEYKLIHMTGGPFGPITWLDYSRDRDEWWDQDNWTSGLGSALMVTLYAGYTGNIDWGTGWRMPLIDESLANMSGAEGYEGPDANGYHDYRYGYNMLNSELGYLYYEELKNIGYRAKDGSYPADYGLQKAGCFDNLEISEGTEPSAYYWFLTEYSPYPDYAWHFNFSYGRQSYFGKGGDFHALAVRPGAISGPGIIPIHGAAYLLASGLIGLLWLRRLRARQT